MPAVKNLPQDLLGGQHGEIHYLLLVEAIRMVDYQSNIIEDNHSEITVAGKIGHAKNVP